MRVAFLRILMVLGFLLSLSGAARAANVLYWADSWSGTDYWTPALTARGDTVTSATSSADLVTRLTAGTWDVVIISENGNNTSSIWVTAIASYISAGGRVVVNNWYTDAGLEAATQTSIISTNQTVATINAAGISAGLAAGISTNPVTLTNAGWGVFSHSLGLAPASGAESLCDFPDGSCAVLGNAGRTLRLGFIPDGLPAADGARFLQNALGIVLGSVPPPPWATVPVPTLSQWSLGALAVLMSLAMFRRRRSGQ